MGPLPCHHGALCDEGQDITGVLGVGPCVELALCGFVFISLLRMELICGGVPLWGGDSWRLGLGACVQNLCPGWEWPCGEIHVGVHCGWGLMGLRLEFIGGLGLFHPGTALVGRLVWSR
ncbi:hypothetical protein CHARACLAT_014496 [Characodon lateralis]|uniref:Uncharacterized protein n=1 Tax=Characodon lateralis TaxID=208331 RepID=A0ABU7CZV1_9TELE|nr:hypothetical protein [Characodon lateralis]